MSVDGHAPDLDDEDGAPEGLTGKILRGAGLAGGGYLFAQILNLGVYIVLSRLLDPADFGIYASATVLIIFGVLLTGGGMHSALVQRRDRFEEAQSTAFAAGVAGGVALGILSLAVAPLLGLIFDNGRVTALAAVASGLVFVNTVAVVPNAILQRRFSVVRFTVVDPLEVLAFGTVAIFFAIEGLGPWALLIGQYAGLATSTTLVWVLARWRPDASLVSFGMWKELASYGRHLLVSEAIQRFGVQAADTVVIGRWLGPASLGQFRYAFRIATLPFTVLLAGAGYVIFPALSRISTDRVRFQAAFLRSLRWMATFGFPAGMILVPLGPALTVIVFGDVWLPAGNAAIAMCAYAGAGAITATVAELLKANGTPAPLTRINFLITVATAGSMLALVTVSLSAAAAGMSIGAAAGAIYAMRIARDSLAIPGQAMIREIWTPLVASMVMAFAVLPLDRLVLHPAEQPVLVGLGLLIVEGALCILVFAAVIALLAPHLLREARSTIARHGWRRNRRPTRGGDPGSAPPAPVSLVPMFEQQHNPTLASADRAWDEFFSVAAAAIESIAASSARAREQIERSIPEPQGPAADSHYETIAGIGEALVQRTAAVDAECRRIFEILDRVGRQFAPGHEVEAVPEREAASEGEAVFEGEAVLEGEGVSEGVRLLATQMEMGGETPQRIAERLEAEFGVTAGAAVVAELLRGRGSAE